MPKDVTAVRSPSCEALGVRHLRSVPPRERFPPLVSHAHAQGDSWPRGHYPWPVCSAELFGEQRDGVQPRPLTVLMVADRRYSVRIRSWAASVRRANASCAVGDVGDAGDAPADGPGSAASAACAAAASAGCACFTPPTRAAVGAHRSDVNGVMALAVRWRFRYALALLGREAPFTENSFDFVVL